MRVLPLLLLIPSLVSAQEIIRLPKRLCEVFDHSLSVRPVSIRAKVDRAVASFFREFNAKEAVDLLEDLPKVWYRFGGQLIPRPQEMEALRKGLVLLGRAYVLSNQKQKAQQVLGLATMLFGDSIKREGFFSPDLGPLIPKPTLEVWLKVILPKEDCRFKVDGKDPASNPLRVSKGVHWITVSCPEAPLWIERVEVTGPVELKTDPYILSVATLTSGCRATLKDPKKAFESLGLILGKDRFVTESGNTWTKRNGQWGRLVPHHLSVRTKVAPRRVAKVRVLPIVAAGIAVAALGAGVTFNWLANSTTERINSGEPLVDRRKAYVIAGWASYGISAASALAAGILWGIGGFTHVVVVPSTTGVSGGVWF